MAGQITPTVGQNEAPNVVFLAGFQAALKNNSIPILDMQTLDEHSVVVDYQLCSDDDAEAIGSEFGTILDTRVDTWRGIREIVNAPIDVHLRGWGSEHEEAVTYWIRATWVESFVDDTLTHEELATKMEATIERHE